MKRVAVIGSGTMGNGIAQVFAQQGWDVVLVDVAQSALDKALATITANLERMVKKGTLTAEAAAAVPGRITTATDVAAAKDASLVVEAASENAALKKGASSNIRMKVSEKGAVSVYGMGRFPVTLYKEQWLKLLGMADDIRAFIAANEAQLKAKD